MKEREIVREGGAITLDTLVLQTNILNGYQLHCRPTALVLNI